MFDYEKMRIMRLTKHWTQAELAWRADMSKFSILNYEKGRRSPSIDGLCRLAKALDIDAAELIKEE